MAQPGAQKEGSLSTQIRDSTKHANIETDNE